MKTAELILVGAVVLAGCTTLPDRDGGPDRDDAPSCSCAGLECGDDGCGGTCGTCPAGRSCVAGSCSGCTPSCAGRACGDDGCGGLCGTCPTGQVCSSGACVCTPSCAGLECGDDGCGGSCGDCGAGDVCSSGLCECASPITCYRDADGDGFVGDAVEACGSCPAGYALLEVGQEVDCLDDPSNARSADVYPGAEDFHLVPYCTGSATECASASPPTSFDYDCDGREEGCFSMYTGSGLCTIGSHGISLCRGVYSTSCTPAGYVDVPPPCGESAEWKTCCTTEPSTAQPCR